MIQFNELRITPDAKYLIIEAEVKSDSYFDNVGIYNLQIFKIKDAEYTKESLLSNFPKNENDSKIPLEIYLENSKIKRIRYVLNNESLNVDLRGAFLEILIGTEGESGAPEGYANSTVYAPVMDLYPFYINTLSNIKMLDNLCSNSEGLVDNILRYKALELSLKTGNKNLAAQYWFKYFKPLNDISGRPFIINKCYE